jgi:hypothetical protein
LTKIADIRKSVRMKTVDKHIAELEAELKTARSDRSKLYASQKIECPHCGKKHKVEELMLIRGMRYHASYSSYEDPSWDPDKTFYSVCPSCTTLFAYTDPKWVAEFSEHFHQAKEGSLQLRKNDDGGRRDRTGKISVMATDSCYHGYKEVLVPYEAIAKAENGRIHRFPMYR